MNIYFKQIFKTFVVVFDVIRYFNIYIIYNRYTERINFGKYGRHKKNYSTV